MALIELCVLSALLTASTDSASPAGEVLPRSVPQNTDESRVEPRRSSQPAGGTPEPATMLLVAGAALGYGAMRRRGSKVTPKVTTDV